MSNVVILEDTTPDCDYESSVKIPETTIVCTLSEEDRFQFCNNPFDTKECSGCPYARIEPKTRKYPRRTVINPKY